MARTKKAKPLTHGEIAGRIRSRYPAPEWVVIEEIQPGVGFDVGRRTDALALSTWESRGLRLLGFEYKSSRADVLAELKNPAKAEATARFCDYWYLVLGRSDLCGKDEVPAKWGLIVPHGTGLRIAKHAEKLNPEPWSRSFSCILTRRAAGHSISDSEREAAERVGYERGMASAQHYRERLTKLEQKLKVFAQASGCDIHAWTADTRLEQLGKLLKVLANGGVEAHREAARRLAERLERAGRDLREGLDEDTGP